MVRWEYSFIQEPKPSHRAGDNQNHLISLAWQEWVHPLLGHHDVVSSSTFGKGSCHASACVHDYFIIIVSFLVVYYYYYYCDYLIWLYCCRIRACKMDEIQEKIQITDSLSVRLCYNILMHRKYYLFQIYTLVFIYACYYSDCLMRPVLCNIMRI
jgi:hypothetical protein